MVGYRITVVVLHLSALALVGYGAWLYSPPAAALAVGSLLWIDLKLSGRR